MAAAETSPLKIGRLTISDRASAGVYADLSGPAIEESLAGLFGGTASFIRALTPDERPQIAAALRRLCDEDRCALVVTTGGTGVQDDFSRLPVNRGVAKIRPHVNAGIGTRRHGLY